MPFNTGNPVPSNAGEDLDDNCRFFDEFAAGTAPTATDRLGNTRLTIQGVIDAATTGNPAVGAAQDALASADRAEVQADRAEAQGDRAETARDAAFVNADVYPDVATGDRKSVG